MSDDVFFGRPAVGSVPASPGDNTSSTRAGDGSSPAAADHDAPSGRIAEGGHPDPGGHATASGDGGALTRRDALRLLGVLPLALGVPLPFRWTEPEVAQAAARVAGLPPAAGAAYVPRFFTAPEYATVRLLADMVIPADEQSGSASDARVPEFMDFMLGDGPQARRVAFRGGLAWLDGESRRRTGQPFVAASEQARAAILDDIAWPKKAPASLSQGVAFFSAFRDLTASGFFSSEIGYKDLSWTYSAVAGWNGCGDAANAHALRAPQAKAVG